MLLTFNEPKFAWQWPMGDRGCSRHGTLQSCCIPAWELGEACMCVVLRCLWLIIRYELCCVQEWEVQGGHQP